MHWVVKLTSHGGQYRVTIPRELVEKARLEGVEYVKLYSVDEGAIIIGEYHGKRREKRDFPED